jgi:hypothetical protein
VGEDAGAVGVERVVVPGIGEAALEPDFAGVGDDEKIETAEEGGFTRSAGAEDGGDGAGADRERHAVERGEGGEAFNKTVRLQDG